MKRIPEQYGLDEDQVYGDWPDVSQLETIGDRIQEERAQRLVDDEFDVDRCNAAIRALNLLTGGV